MSPKSILSRKVAEHVDRCYGIDYSPRIVRQERQIKTDKIKFLDYSTPCFEIAKLLNDNPQDVARTLRQSIENDDGHSSAYCMDDFGGYINFEFNLDFLSKIRNNITFRKSMKTYNVLSFKYLENNNFNTECLDDILAKTLKLIVPPNNLNLFECSFILDKNLVNVKKILDNNVVSSNLLDSSKILKSIMKLNESIVADNNTSALYFSDTNSQYFPLITASGKMLKHYYIAASIISYFIANNKTDSQIIVLLPQKYHVFVSELFYIFRSRIILFDPMVSKKDLTNIENNMFFTRKLELMDRVVSCMSEDILLDKNLRKVALGLFDFNEDLLFFLYDVHIASICSTVSEAIIGVKKLRV